MYIYNCTDMKYNVGISIRISAQIYVGEEVLAFRVWEGLDVRDWGV